MPMKDIDICQWTDLGILLMPLHVLQQGFLVPIASNLCFCYQLSRANILSKYSLCLPTGNYSWVLLAVVIVPKTSNPRCAFRPLPSRSNLPVARWAGEFLNIWDSVKNLI